MLLFTGQNLLRIYPAFTFMDCAKHTKKSKKSAQSVQSSRRDMCFLINKFLRNDLADGADWIFFEHEPLARRSQSHESTESLTMESVRKPSGWDS